MSKKLAGLPLWAWGIAAVVGVGLGLYLRSRGSSSNAAGSIAPQSSVPLTDAAAGGQTVASPESGLNSDLISLIASSQNALVADNQTLAQLTESSVSGALGLGSEIVDLWTMFQQPPTPQTPSSPKGATPTPSQPDLPRTLPPGAKKGGGTTRKIDPLTKPPIFYTK